MPSTKQLVVIAGVAILAVYLTLRVTAVREFVFGDKSDAVKPSKAS